MLTPLDFGLPPKFTAWRSAQWEAISRVLDSPERFVCLCAPTGFGKTLVGIAAAQMSGRRTVYLTSTKGLQDQIAVADFPDNSTDIRGMQNYRCEIPAEFQFPAYTRVNDAPCQSGASCRLKANGCRYFDQYRKAQQADIVVTNYQCWMYDKKRGGKGLGMDKPVEMLIMDEAHDSIGEVCSYLSVTLERKDCLAAGLTWPQNGYQQQEWVDWAEYWKDRLEERVEELQAEVQAGAGNTYTLLHEIRELRDLARKLAQVADMQEEWVIEGKDQDRHDNGTSKTVTFDPLWPRRYAESVLFRGVPKVVLVSATVRPKTAELLGVPESELAFEEYGSSFPVERRPVIHVPTVRMNYRTEQDDRQMALWLRMIDLLLDRRADRNGIVHTVSYRRARFLVDNSRHRGRMLVHGTDTRAETIERFRRSEPGTVLVSPSVDTGYDFPYAMSEYQIVAKLPWPDTRGAVMKARTKGDREYGAYLTAQTLQQMTGRVMRAEDDMGETICVDDNISWFVPRYKRYFNEWWLQAYRTQRGRLPEPLPKL
jgi:ATP-dependent DNA helicase DinG